MRRIPVIAALGLSLLAAGCHGKAQKAAPPDGYSVGELKRAFAGAKLQLADLSGSPDPKAKVLMSADYSVGVAVYPRAGGRVVSLIASGEKLVWRKNVAVTYREGSGRLPLIRHAFALLVARHVAPGAARG